MTLPDSEAAHPEFTQQARTSVELAAEAYTRALVRFAEAEAVIDAADHIGSNHVRKAQERVLDRRRASRSRQIGLAIGGAFLGAFVQGFATEIRQNPVDEALVTTWVVMGLVGLGAVLLAVR